MPGSLFFLWGPITDFLLRRRTWVLLSSAAAGGAVMLTLAMTSYASRGAVTLLWVASCLILLGYAALGGLAVLLMRPDQKTRVGCFLQAGNLAGMALSGGVLLLVATHLGKVALVLAAGAITFAPGLLVLLFDEPPVTKRGRDFNTEMLLMAGSSDATKSPEGRLKKLARQALDSGAVRNSQSRIFEMEVT